MFPKHNANVQARTIRSLEEFESLRDGWTTLFKESNCNEAFLTWEWLYAWWKYHNEDKQLWIETVWRGERLDCIIPLMLIKTKKDGVSLRDLCNLGHPDNDISGVVMRDRDREVIEAAFRHLMEQSSEWDAMTIYNISVSSNQTQAFCSEARANGCWMLEKHEPHYHIPIVTEWERYFESLPDSLRGYINRHTKNVTKKGELRYEIYTGENLKWDHFLKIFEINAHARHPHLYATENERNFAKAIFDLTQGQDWVEVDFLCFNNMPVAFNYGFSMAGRHEGWRMAFDGDYYKLGIGKILSKHMTESFFKRGFREFDFLQGLEEYKKEWLPSERDFMELRIVPGRKLISAVVFVVLPKIKMWWSGLRSQRDSSPPRSSE